MPGGGIESHETPTQTIIRELFEECGLTITAEQITGWETTRFAPHGVLAHVLVDAPQETEDVHWQSADDAVSEVRWFKELPELKTWDVQEFTDIAQWAAGQ